MTRPTNPPRIPLPGGWSLHVKSAMLHVISLAQFGLAYTRGWAVSSPIARIRLKTENARVGTQSHVGRVPPGRACDMSKQACSILV